MADMVPSTSENFKVDQDSVAPAKTISEVLGVDSLLPGESVADYQQGLKELIAELGASSILQVYLAEKIYECLWWMRRYDEQKRATIIAEMVVQTNGGYISKMTKDQIHLRESLLGNEIDQNILDTTGAIGHSVESLRQLAMSRRRGELNLLDQQIALQANILAGFQASYEIAFNRKRNVERLDLQNALLRRDLKALDGELANDKPKAKSR